MEKYKIILLIVEKDKSILDCLVKATSKHITNVIVAKNSSVAYQLYLKNRPDIILTDFSTLPKTGGSFIEQIRKHEKKTRIIIMSSKVEPEFFIKSIEYGVKGFLIKPIVETQLAQLLSQQAKAIQLEKDFETEELKRLEAENERDLNDQILKTLSQAVALFYRYGVSPANINKILKLIGKATKSSRVNIFKNFNEDDESFTGLFYTWASKKIYDISDNELLKKIPFSMEPFSHWGTVMKKGKSVVGNVTNFATYERKMLEENSVKSILSVPISVDGKWWGFLSLDNCEVEKVWTRAEVMAFEAVAYNLGAAIYRLRVEREMIRVNESLESRVRERTAALEDEIAERMLTEEMLKDSEEKYRMIYENSINGIVLIQHNKVLLVSPSMIDIMERSPKLLIGEFFGSYIVSKTPKEIRKELLSFQENEPQSTRIEITIPNKENKWLELKTKKISWDDRPAFLIFAKDISLQVTAESELKLLNKNLEKRIIKEVKQVNKQQQLLIQKSKLESLGELLAGLAHEINQPLLGISMGLDNILMSAQEDTFNKSYVNNKVEVLFKDIDRIKKIIEHVRTFSRGQKNIRKEKIEINALIRNALLLTNKMLQEESISFKVGYSKNEVYVWGNPYRLEQVILNLLSNAKHAVNEKEITLNNKYSNKEILLESSQISDSVFIKVKDNGIGIPKDIISNIFDPFFTTRSVEKGTGLGLSISYGIIEEMKGKLHVKSIEKEETVVTIELPIYKSSEI